MRSAEMTLLIPIFFALFTVDLGAQAGGSISGEVHDGATGPVVFANVILYRAQDSAVAKVEYSNENGAFQFVNLPAGSYWLDVSYVGLAPFRGNTFQLDDGQLMKWPLIELRKNTTELDEVVVTGQKPILEQQNDRVVFNVEKSINAAGANALELLQKSPGVLLDNNGNISMMGRNGVIVAINGKNSPLRGDDLVAYLRTLQGNQIEAIEIIADPGAQYEAAGNAGIVNIRLKKDDSRGANGNVALGYSIGELPRYNGSLSGNFRKDALNLFGSYGYNLYQNPYDEKVDILQKDFFLDQFTAGNLEIRNHAFKTGMDLALGSESVLGFMAVGNLSEWDWLAETRTDIGSVEDGAVDSILIAQSHTLIDRTDLSFNLNYRFENEEGILWNMDADYALYHNDRQNTQPNEFRDPSNSVTLSERNFYTHSPTEIAIYTFQANHERPLGAGKLGAGIKGSYVNADNAFAFYQVFDEESILDTERSNQFVYQENVNAAYLTYSSPLGEKVNLAAGLRAEQTNSIGELSDLQGAPKEKVKRNYLDFFPSVKLGFTPNEKHTLQISYSRRINRPPYQQLNPFQFKVDELSYVQGNPFLQPEYATVLRLQHSLQNGLTTTLAYSHVKDLIAQLYEAGEDNTNIYTTVNLADQHHYSINVGAPVSPADWWSSYGNLTVFYVENKGNLEGITIDKQATAVNLSLQNTFQLPGDFSLELSGFYNSPTLWGANEEIGTIWSVDIGIEKTIFDEQGTLGLSVSDIFRTNIWPSVSEFGPIYVDYTRREDTRRLNVSLSYRFGNNKLKDARQRERGLEEEKRRTN